MSRMRVLAARVRGLFRRTRADRDLDDEIRFHLEMQAEDNLRAGLDADEARHAARRSFGAIEPMKEAHREQRAFVFAESLVQDFRYALRTLGKSPGFAVTSITVLALAIGANTAMFSALDAVLIQPLPFPKPHELAMLWTEVPSQNVREGRSAWWNFDQWRNQAKIFADLAAFDPASVTVTGAGMPEQLSAARTSPNLFSLLGVQPVLGRSFTAREAEQKQRLVVISSRLWQNRFAGSNDVIGAAMEIDGSAFRVVGVLPADFQFARFSADIWEPATLSPDWNPDVRGAGPWFVVGRLRSGVTIDSARAEMTVIAHRIEALTAARNGSLGIGVVSLKQQLVGGRSESALWMLMAALSCVLLIAASNVAGLSLARGATRTQELAVRGALGASRGRIVRQLLVESMTLAVVSGVLGLLVGLACMRILQALQPWRLDRLNHLGLDPLVLGWAMTLCLVTGILVGLAPALMISRRNLMPSGGGARGVSRGVGARSFRRVLVVAQFALAAVLLTGAGLLIRSLWSAESVDHGFRPERTLSMQLSTAAMRSTAQRVDFYQRVLREIQAVPGVEHAGIIDDLFVSTGAEQVLVVENEQRDLPLRIRFRLDAISDRLFRTLGAPMLRGRSFTAADGADAPRVAIVNETMARRAWPASDPLGKRFRIGSGMPERWITVVGVVGDMRRQGPENDILPQVFEPLAQDPSRLMTLIVKTAAAEPLTMAGAMRAAVYRVDRRAPLYGITTLENRLGSFLTTRRFETSLLMWFSGVAMLMASVGIYGLIQYSISTRTQEIGIRVAVGAQRGEILRMVLSEGMKLSIAGLAAGLAGAMALGRAASSMLFGVAATDAWTLAAVSLLLTFAGLAACYFPARRAMKIDPIAALRNDN